MLEPRNTPVGTRADLQLRRDFWGQYVRAYHFGGNDAPIGSANAIFTETVLTRLNACITAGAMRTPVLFTDLLSNRVLAGCCELENGSRIIAVNARFKVDPETLAHTLLEEFVHVQQALDGVNFTAQQQQYAYADRPYEQAAKQIASDILGYTPDERGAELRREESVGPLYDHPTPRD